MRFLFNKRNEIRGWQILALFGIMAVIFAVKLTAHTGWSNNTRAAVVVMTIMFAAMGLIMAAVDWMQRRRARQQELGQPSHIPAWFFAEHNPRSSQRLGGVLGVILIPAFVAAIGPRFYREWASLGWTPTQGQSVSVQVQEGYKEYKVITEMRYSFAGQWHCEKLQAGGSDKITSKATAARLQQAFAVGTTHPVYVDPAQPAQASLHRGPGIGIMIGSVTIPLFSAWLFILSVKSLRGSTKRRAGDYAIADDRDLVNESMKRAA